MEVRERRTGRCLCGSVRYEVETAREVLHCHCENCRRVSGNFAAAVRVRTADLNITDPDGALRWHELGYARYGFCSSCGSAIFYQAAARMHLTSVMVGTLDDASGLEVGAVWYASEAQPHQHLPTGVPHFPGDGAVSDP